MKRPPPTLLMMHSARIDRAEFPVHRNRTLNVLSSLIAEFSRPMVKNVTHASGTKRHLCLWLGNIVWEAVIRDQGVAVFRCAAAYHIVTAAAMTSSGMAPTLTQFQPKKWMNAPDDRDPIATTV